MHVRLTMAGALLAVACGADDGSTEKQPPPSSDWSRYGFDLAGTRASPETFLSPANVGGLREKWRVEMPGCTATPAIVDGIAYVGDWFGHAYAIEVATGRVLWDVVASDGAIDDSPLVAEGSVYLGDGIGNLIRLDQDTGAPIWKVELDTHQSAHIYSSPVIVDDILLIGVASLELVSPGTEFTFRGSLVGIDPQTGAELWRTYLTEDDATSGAGVSVWSSFSVDPERKLAFIGSGQTYEAPASPLSDSLVAVRYDTGAVAWHRQYTAGDVFTIFHGDGPDFDIGAAPTLFSAGGRDLVAVGDKGGSIAAFDRETGESAWGPVTLSQGSPQGGVMGPAAFAEGKLFVSSNEFRVADGSIDVPEAGDVHFVTALDAATGATVWQKERPYPSVGGMAWVNGLLLMTSDDGTLHAIDAATGEDAYSAALGNVAASGPSTSGGSVVVSYGFSFFKTGAGGIIDGGLVAYGLP